jgi:hypothetical protein
MIIESYKIIFSILSKIFRVGERERVFLFLICTGRGS